MSFYIWLVDFSRIEHSSPHCNCSWQRYLISVLKYYVCYKYPIQLNISNPIEGIFFNVFALSQNAELWQYRFIYQRTYYLLLIFPLLDCLIERVQPSARLPSTCWLEILRQSNTFFLFKEMKQRTYYLLLTFPLLNCLIERVQPSVRLPSTCWLEILRQSSTFFLFKEMKKR